MPVSTRIMTSCVPVCASGINSVKNVLMMTPICITVLRLMRSEIASAMNAPTTIRRVGATASQRICSGVKCSGSFASTSREPPSARS